MPSPWQYALTVGPLGFYLWTLALWQGDRHPRVVRGLVDFAMLVFGLGGLLAFGPFGQLVTRMLFRQPDLIDRTAVASGLGLVACWLARGANRRLVVYHVDPERLVPALGEVLNETGGRFVRTLGGFEDVTRTRGVRVEFTRPFRCATVEAIGPEAEEFIRAIRPRLEHRLAGLVSRTSAFSVLLHGCSILVLLVPLAGLFLAQPRTRDAFRVLLERLRGG